MQNQAVQTTVPNLTPTGNTPVARDIEVQIPSRYLGEGFVLPAPLPDGHTPIADFVKVCLPGHRIETIARAEMLDVGDWAKKTMQPSSLFFQAAHACFQMHYPLALRPEVLWSLIVNEIATTVKMHPDDYRDQFNVYSNE